MTSPRQRRLGADYEQVMAAFSGHRHVTVQPEGSVPPERYTITYRVKGLAPGPGDQPRVVDVHKAVIYLHSTYPREKPQCTMLTPVFHPNFGSYVCIGDQWTAGQSLVDLIVHIGDMIQYRNYNPRSALNVPAAYWAMAHPNRIPISDIDLYPAEPDLSLAVESRAQAAPARDSLDIEVTLAPRSRPADDLDITLAPKPSRWGTGGGTDRGSTPDGP